ncbi:MAG: hypothetical protein JWO03_3711 [Bacteroidetes bacterium]|nr:hypothetical protein [Bacteroidota bacterium]
MVKFTTTILRFGEQGEKTGWTYIEVPADVAQKLKPGNKKSFRVKGKLDEFKIERVALMPMGDGGFILPLNAAMRKGTGKRKGAKLTLTIEVDDAPLVLNGEFMDCLTDEPKALAHFNTLAKSHQNYFSKWIDSAKTEETKANRIARALNALSKQMGYPEMLRSEKANKDRLI